MSIFSDESLLLLSNWDTVQDILAAERRLRREFPELLSSLEPELAKNDWWQDGWVFESRWDTEAYIANRNWQSKDTHLIWIGVEQFGLENLLGVKTSPNLYVWVAGREKGRAEFAQRLAGWIVSRYKVLDEVESGLDGYYVVSELITPLPPEVTEETVALVRKRILDFFCDYAKAVWSFDALIRDYLGTGPK
jgi:hypothetical protein